LLFRSRLLPSEYTGGKLFDLFDKIGIAQQAAGPFMTTQGFIFFCRQIAGPQLPPIRAYRKQWLNLYQYVIFTLKMGLGIAPFVIFRLCDDACLDRI